MIFRQLFEPETSTYTYLLADEETREAVIIDSVIETAERDLTLIRELGLNLKYILETHIHADHITGAHLLRKETGAQTVVSSTAPVKCADKFLEDGEAVKFGKYELKSIYTPGHTDTCVSFLVDDKLFTGDALLIRGTGRTDFQKGSPETLFKSIREKLFTLPDETYIYPGHDYKGRTVSTVAEEKKFNPRLNMSMSQEDFVEIMNNLNLPNPKKIDVAVP
ncbi:MAG: MBL fold metallo-hydrolase, partial [Bdellovibrionales bacterium]|nr:MBL fold metallo-hydrolase [Bdellovibrionales bacterium]